MTVAAAQHCQQRKKSSLVVHVHVMGGEAMWAALLLMRVLTPVCPRAAVVWSAAHLGRVISRADTRGHTQQPLITVGDVTIVEHFVK